MESAITNKTEIYMKKIITLILLLSLLLGVFASCKKDDDLPEGEDNENTEGGENGGTDGDDSGDGSGDGNNDFTDGDIGNKEDKFNIMTEDLSDYIAIDKQLYTDYEVVIDRSMVDLLIEHEVIKALYKHKGKEKIEGDGVISVGDTVNIYYKGYYMDGEEKVFFDGGDNTAAEKPHALGIGSGGFIPGFEYNLIGKNPADYSEDSPLIVETYFPEGYSSDELAGRIAYFIVTVESIEEYDAPEFTDEFITDTLGVSLDELEGFEGEGLTDKYRASLRDQVIMEYGLDDDTKALAAFWEISLEGAVVKKYPETLLKELYDGLIEQLDYYYRLYGGYYGLERDEFMCMYIGLEEGADWEAEVDRIAKSNLKQQLIFYHIMNIEGLKPDEQEYDEIFNDYVERALEDVSITREDFATAEEYIAKRDKYKSQLIESKGEEYFMSMFYYQIGVEAILGYANITVIE